jgi:hypothetical protein
METGGTMETAAQREWVSLRDAAAEVGIAMTTVRDWARGGSIESRQLPDGRLVDLQQVRAKAMGPVAVRRQSNLQDRVSDGTASRRAPHDPLSKTLIGLQELARERDA